MVLSTRAGWTVIVVSTACRSLLFMGLALLLWGTLPGLIGFETTVVMSGSMTPGLQVGDSVVVRHVDVNSLVPGQVLLFDDPDQPGRLRMHRLMTMDDDGLVTRGDANADADSSHVPFASVHGAGFLRVPFGGMPEYWIRTGQPVPLVLTGAVALLLFAGASLCRLLEEDPEPRQRRRHRGPRITTAGRIAASGAVILVLAGGLGARPDSAQASFSARTTNGVDRWSSGCADLVPASLLSTARFYWGYGPAAGSTVTDLSTKSDPGMLAGTAVRSGCADTTRPYVSVGTGGPGAVIESKSTPLPGDMTIATWFRTSSPGGVLVDFGNSLAASNTSSLGTSSRVDRALYMQDNGNLSFGAATLSVLGATGKMTCTTTNTATNGYADGRWHLAVATWSNAAGCSLSVDNGTAVTNSPLLTLSVLSGFTGAWRAGYEALDSSWTNAPTRSSFVGDLDETQLYGERNPGIAATFSPLGRQLTSTP